MPERFDWVEDRYRELTEQLSHPEEIGQGRENMMKEFTRLEPMRALYLRLRGLEEELEGARQLLEDEEFRDEARKEIEGLEKEQDELTHQLEILLLPPNPDADKNVVLEIRQGAGGEEAALFGAMLLRMYCRYAERHGFTVEPVSDSMTELGGVKEAVLTISGKNVFEKLQFESGVHRIQRVPTTEAGGRIHTSTCTVAVLPEAENVEIHIDPSEIRVDTYRSGGAGGQHVNRTDSAVRMTHIPTGIVAQCQNERSQIQNREVCLRILKSRLYDRMREEKDREYAARRKGQVGTGDRSERIRTYNFPQGRVTDHRIGLTLYRVDELVDGDLDEIIDALLLAEQEEKLREKASF